MELTADQRRAVATEGRDLCVTAGAGSGKTRVLVERIVHLVLRESDPHDLGAILAITFTQKAAREMKERLARRFATAERSDLRTQVEWAHVSTIHAFCARLLRENAVEAEVDPAFEVLDETEASALLRESLEAAVTEVRQSRPDDLEAIGRIAVDDPEAAALGLYAELRAAGVAPGDVPVPDLAPEVLREAVEAVVEGIRALGPLLDGATAAGRARAGSVLGHEPAVSSLLAEEIDPEEARRVLLKLAKSIDLRTGGDVKAALAELRNERISRARAAVADRLAQPALLALRALLVELDARHTARKKELGALDFADLELLTLALLRSRPEVREDLAGRFSQILVDEVQDVNRVQASIVAELRTPGRHFAVGDVKQSIYGFRHAEPSIFREYSREVGDEGLVSLRRNFRSTPGLVALANHCFRTLFDAQELVDWMDMDTPEDAADQPPHEGEVEVLLTAVDSADEARRVEAAVLAERIRAAVETGSARYGDVAILLRAFTDVKTYERALERLEVPFYVVKGRGFFEAREVVDLVRLLECVRNPRDSLSFACALRSPFCGLGEDALLALVRAAEGIGEEGRLADLLADPAAVEGLSPMDRERWLSFAELLSDMRALVGRASLREIIETALDRSGYGAAVWIMGGARRRAANLRKVLEVADSLGGVTGLAGFLGHLRDLRIREVRETEAPSGGEREDVVRLLTVHAAKGLQFPWVLLPDLSRQPGVRVGGLLVDDAGLGAEVAIGPERDRLETGLHVEQKERRKRREEEESIRLLYVAMTRAERRITLSAREGKAPSGSWWGRLEPLLVSDGEAAEFGDGGRRATVLRPGGARPVERREPPLKRTHGEDIARGRPIPDVSEEHDEWARELTREARRTLPEPDRTAYENTISELLAFAACRRCYVERYRLGIPRIDLARSSDPEAVLECEEDRPGLDELPPRNLGIAVHEVLKVYDPHGDVPLEEIVRDRLNGLGSAGSALDAPIIGMVRSFYESEVGREVREAAPEDVRREVPFLTRWELPDGSGLLLRGQIDLLYPRPNGVLRIVDYKTGRSPPGRYRHQLVAYARALSQFAGRPVDEACLVYLNPGEAPVLAPVEIGGAAEEGLLAKVEEFARFTARNDPAPETHDPGCPSYR